MAWARRCTSSTLALRLFRRAMTGAYDGSGMQSRALEDLVDAVLRSVHRQPDEVEVGTGDCTDRGPVGLVVPGTEHVGGVHRDRQLPAQRSLPGCDQVLLAALEDED